MKQIYVFGILRCRMHNLFLALLISGVMLAQEGGGGGDGNLNLPINYGVKLGAEVSSFTNEQPFTNSIIGFSGGAFVNYSINSSMGVQLELLYKQSGGRLLTYDYPALLGQDDWYSMNVDNQKLVIHYINIPVMFRYSYPLKGIKLIGLIGPDFGYAINALAHKESTVFTDAGSFHTYKETEKVYSNIEKFNISATAGVGVEIPVGDFLLFIDGRYNYGITPCYKSYSYIGIPQITGDLSCNSFSLSLGLGF